MESGGIVRTVILIGLFLVLVCDYSTLISQMYQSFNNAGNASQPFFSDETGESQVRRSSPAFREDKTELDLDADLDFKNLNLFG